MSKKFYTVADIAKSTGYNRSTITRWLAKHKIKNAQMKGNAPLYSAQVLEGDRIILCVRMNSSLK